MRLELIRTFYAYFLFWLFMSAVLIGLSLALVLPAWRRYAAGEGGAGEPILYSSVLAYNVVLSFVKLIPCFADLPRVLKGGEKVLYGKIVGFKETSEGDPPETIYHPIAESGDGKIRVKMKAAEGEFDGTEYGMKCTFLYLQHTKLSVVSADLKKTGRSALKKK